IQPTIRPLFEGKSPIEFLHTIVTGETADGYDLVQETWRNILPGDFEKAWQKMLHDGLHGVEPFPEVNPSISGGLASIINEAKTSDEATDGIELVIRPDSTIYDGRYANNAWLQEL